MSRRHALMQRRSASSLLSRLATVACLASLAGLTFFSAHSQAAPSVVMVEAFGTSSMAFTQVTGATIYRLDGLSLLEAEMSQGLPNDPVEAQQVLQMRLRAMGGDFAQRVNQTTLGLMKAKGYGIDRVPAVVLDGRAIVYGVTDIQRAVALYQARQATPARRSGLPAGMDGQSPAAGKAGVR